MTEDAQSYIELAESCARDGALQRAADNYELALRFESGSITALVGLTGVLLKSGSLDEARRALGKALTLDREHPEVMKLQAELHARSGRFDLAVKAIHQATEADMDRKRYRRRR